MHVLDCLVEGRGHFECLSPLDDQCIDMWQVVYALCLEVTCTHALKKAFLHPLTHAVSHKNSHTMRAWRQAVNARLVCVGLPECLIEIAARASVRAKEPPVLACVSESV